MFGAVEGGYRVLLDELAVRSRARWVNAPIVGIAAETTGWALRDATGAVSRADAVVLALPARAPPLCSARSPPGRGGRRPGAGRLGGGAGHGRRAGHPVSAAVRCAGGRGETLHSKAITLSSRKWGRRGGAELLRLSFGRFGDDIARTTPDERLIAWALEDLDTVFGISVDPLEVLVHRWIDALPQYGPGHADLAAEVRAGLPPGLAVAGNFLDGVGVPACLAAAGRAAVAAVAAVGTG